MEFLIREVEKKDYAKMDSLFEELAEYHRKELPHVFKKPDGPAQTQDFLSGVFADPSAVIFIAEIKGQIVGLIYAYIRSVPEIPIRVSGREGEVDQLIVKNKYRSRGIGKALMERVHQWAGQMKLDRLELSVWDFNQETRDFYRDLDYRPAFHRMWKIGPFT